VSLPPHVAWLLDHAPGLPPGESARLVQTHISFVVLAGERVYKIKKPVDFGFLDFTTADKRARMCAAEVERNSRLSPDVYLGVAPIRPRGDGFALGATGPGDADPIDYAVVMRRLPDGGMLESILAEGRATAVHARAIAEVVAAFHLGAERGPAITEFGSRAVVEGNWDENFRQTEDAIGDTIDRAAFDAIRDYVARFLDGNAGLLRRRRDEGWIRDGHGDLKVTAVAFEPGPADGVGDVRILDCIEFNDRMRYGDVAADLAFLLMDFASRGRADLADELLAHYLARTLDADLPLLLPFYECYRAYVVGKISTFAAADPHLPSADREAAREGARHHFRLAAGYAARGAGARLIVVAGPSGSGKSTLATALAGRLGGRWLSSDIVRKRLAGLDPTAATGSGVGTGLYDAATTARTYDALLREAGASLRDGHPAILDATFVDPAQRDEAAGLARRLDVPCDLLVCEAADEVVRARMRIRAGDPAAVSEGTWAIHERQRPAFDEVRLPPPARVHRIDSGEALARSVPAALRLLGVGAP
jgi:hypothetical protein